MRNFSEVLIGLRKNKNMTQRELAEELSLSHSTIGMYESDKRRPDFETLELIADYFNVDMNYLLGKTLIKNSYQEMRNQLAHGLDPEIDPNSYEYALYGEVKELSDEDKEHLLDMARFLKSKKYKK